MTGEPRSADEVHFVRALDRFDVLDYSPHFPGYPLAVLLARSSLLPGGYAYQALSVVGTLVAALIVASVLTPRARVPAFAVTASAPYLVGQSLAIGSDAIFLPFLAASLALCFRNAPRPFLGGLILGLALGVRPSAFTWCALLAGATNRRRACLGFGVGVASWILPFIALAGSDVLLAEGSRFLAGHFSRWGAPLLAAVAPNAASWPELVVRHWLLEPISGDGNLSGWQYSYTPILLVLLTLAGARATRELPARLRCALVVSGGATICWLLAAQNPVHARHVLPPALLALPLAGAEIARGLPRTLALIGLLLLLTLATHASLRTRAQGLAMRNTWQQLASQPKLDFGTHRVYADEEFAYLRYREPHWPLAAAASSEAARIDAQGLPIVPRKIWVTSGVDGTPTGAVRLLSESDRDD
ncbi:MAG: hypothetical protein ACKVX7_09385 [Planctomycetota bacterium]